MAKKHLMGWLAVAGVATLVAGCSGNQQSGERGQQPGTTGGSQEQVISKEVQPGQPGVGGTEVKRGETEVQGQREVVTKRTEPLKEEVPTVAKGQEKLDVNRMDAKDFVALGLNQDTADRIVKYRDDHGPFRSINDLSAVQGIDQNWLNQYRDRLAFVSPENQESVAGQAGND
jgi:DNA uptake protein ComE-like DNA-binding protein